MMDKQPILTAELNTDGDIGWLWRTDPGKRPRLVKDMAACLQDLDLFVLQGAHKAEIKGWLHRQITSTPGS